MKDERSNVSLPPFEDERPAAKKYSPSASIDETNEYQEIKNDEVIEDDHWEGFESNHSNDDDWGKWKDEEQSNTVTDNQVLKSPSSSLPLDKKAASVTMATDDDLRKNFKGQLSEEDLKRLEEKAQWSIGTDLFADMAPKISKTVRHTVELGTNTIDEEPINCSAKLDYDYNPPESEIDEAWGDEEWNNDDL